MKEARPKEYILYDFTYIKEKIGKNILLKVRIAATLQGGRAVSGRR